MKFLNFLCFDEKGGGIVEYALIIVLITLAAVAVTTTAGTTINTNMTSMDNKL